MTVIWEATGPLTWARSERVSDRYGTVGLTGGSLTGGFRTLVEALYRVHEHVVRLTIETVLTPPV